jgi:(4-(4-[2-(gamma-L-glutamylamino)ethyl]phenoxymethyl)furan-2-yl)methanamine synthase
MNWLALDIGGANLKVADGLDFAQSYAFALWRESDKLAQQIRTAIFEAPPCDHLAVTMTGELADCFESKVAGVRFILQAVNSGSDNRHTRVYLVDGRLVTPQVANNLPHLAAASNWHALARFAGRLAPQGTAILVDVGSTTCDVIPVVDGKPTASGQTDTQRLLSGELVYTGIERSPIAAISQTIPYRGQSCPVAQETFATMQDAYVVLDQINEDLGNTNTCDNRPLTKAASRLRLGRMIAADGDEFNHRDAVTAAHSVSQAQAAMLATAIAKVRARLPAPLGCVVLSGHGEFLGKNALATLPNPVPTISFTEKLGPTLSRCGPAHALAVLAREASGQ